MDPLFDRDVGGFEGRVDIATRKLRVVGEIGAELIMDER